MNGSWKCESLDGTADAAALIADENGEYVVVCHRFLPLEKDGPIGIDAADYRFAPDNMLNKNYSPIMLRQFYSKTNTVATPEVPNVIPNWSNYYPSEFNGAAGLF
jgi:hypothetical protein